MKGNMSNKIEISKIVINIGDKEIELSPEEARSLLGVLKDMLEVEKLIKVEKEYYPIPYSPPYPTYPHPYYPYTTPYWTISWCGTGSTSTSTISLCR
jgi:hypothetical protein